MTAFWPHSEMRWVEECVPRCGWQELRRLQLSIMYQARDSAGMSGQTREPHVLGAAISDSAQPGGTQHSLCSCFFDEVDHKKVDDTHAFLKE